MPLAAGHSRHAAAARAGITYRTLARWQAEDEAFADGVDVAVGTGRGWFEERLRKYGEGEGGKPGDWRALVAAAELAEYGVQPKRRAGEDEPVPEPGRAVPLPIEPSEERTKAILEKLVTAYGGDLERTARLLASHEEPGVATAT